MMTVQTIRKLRVRANAIERSKAVGNVPVVNSSSSTSENTNTNINNTINNTDNNNNNEPHRDE